MSSSAGASIDHLLSDRAVKRHLGAEQIKLN